MQWLICFFLSQIGSHQFKVSGGDWIYVEKLKYADVKQKV
jgi:ribosomal protein L21